MRLPLILAASLLVTGCDVILQPAGMVQGSSTAWREVASDRDRERLRDWRKAFVDALSDARRAGHAAEVAAEGRLLEPDSAIGGPRLAPGMYRCRVIKLGAKSQGMLSYVAYPAFSCRVRAERSLKRLDKLSGSQRYAGLLFPNDAMREVFLGTLVLGDERRAMQYGQDPGRDIAGYAERIGPRRWRLLLPEPQFESRFDVMELVPTDEGDGG